MSQSNNAEPSPRVAELGALRDRRWLLGAAFASSGILAASFAGANVSALAKLALLPSRRADVNSQGLPVQTRASKAGVVDIVQRSDYRVRVSGRAGSPVRAER